MFKISPEARPATIKKKTLAQVSSCEFCEIAQKNFFTEHLWVTASISLETLKD